LLFLNLLCAIFEGGSGESPITLTKKEKIMARFKSVEKLVVSRVDVQERASARTGREYTQCVVSFEGNIRVRTFESDELNFQLLSRLQVGERVNIEFDSVSVFTPSGGESTPSGGQATAQVGPPQVTMEGWKIDWESWEERQLSPLQAKLLERQEREPRRVETTQATVKARDFVVADEETGDDFNPNE